MKERKLESFEAGQYSPAPAEIEAVRAKAKMRGEDPDAAEAALRQKFLEANSRKAIGETELGLGR